MEIIVAITGASGVAIGQRLLECLREHRVHLIVTQAARRVMEYELPGAELPATSTYGEDDLESPLASSSCRAEAMVVAPCSMRTLSGIAHGYEENLVIRAAGNTLRTGKRLILVPRETPLSLPHIENMRLAKLAGALLLPPCVAYYPRPKTIEEVTDFFVGRILELLGLEHHLYPRWKEARIIEEGGGES